MGAIISLFLLDLHILQRGIDYFVLLVPPLSHTREQKA